jgi:hypothetical protein
MSTFRVFMADALRVALRLRKQGGKLTSVEDRGDDGMSVKFRKLLIAALLFMGLAPTALAGGYGWGGYGWGGHYGHGYRHHYGGYYHGYGDDGAYLAFGLFAGTLLGYAIGSSYYGPAYYRRPYYRDYGYYGYYEPAPPRVVYVQPAPVVAPKPRTCVQEREYQTTVIIAGQEVPAWGVACLQPDGTWLRPGLNVAPHG